MWNEFRNSNVDTRWPNIQPLPYIRINPDLKDTVPELDDKQALTKLHDNLHRALTHPEASKDFQRIAFQLVASTFYYARSGPVVSSSGSYTADGKCLQRYYSHSIANGKKARCAAGLTISQIYFGSSETSYVVNKGRTFGHTL
jgi:hypothetical protein